ncbi:T9SS type A sorting domain-containing protein [Dokdonia sp. Hel_I_53]|uniref:T9SS type A sorting domain-containing protein n=1 Tax=Dokdonia sp. Hel_I_53 TaxID=1566287 RepID=UPI00119C4DE5|nr:T9SS type A sorting domain-containing protein [Dokdonia sp. Hel_I_53]TVZ53354.1 putative secreted protein (Por secretion system target) [Dokdonia sp. Hel_I_53]
MKKITLLTCLIFTACNFLFAQTNMLTNGDFEEGATVWEGNAFNVQTEGGNSFNFADVTTAGDAFNVNLSQRGLAITEGETYILTFDANTDATTASRTMIAGIGLFVDPFTSQVEEVTLTENSQTFTLTLVANFSSTDGRVLFDMGADTGTVIIDNVSLVLDDTPAAGDELLSNGDFEEGATAWEGNAFNVQTEGGNSFNFADVTTAGDAFNVNLSQRGLAITEGETYILTFDANTDATTASRTMIAGIGLFVDPFTAQVEEVTLTENSQTFTLTLVANFSSTDGRVLFDMGADTGIVIIDNVSLVLDDTPAAGDELLSNGDFEEGATAWEGNAFNVQTEGGNSFNFADVTTAGDAFNVNLSQRGLAITEGETYILTFDANTDATTASRTMIAGIGLFVDPFTSQVEEVTLTENSQTFTLTLVANFSSTDGRVLFDMGADTGTVIIDNVSLVLDDTPAAGDELLSNGDFEEGATAWEGNAFNLQTEGGNSFNFADVTTAGDAFNVNLSQRGLAITEGETYILTFDANTDATTASRTMIAGIGLFVDPFTAQVEEVTLTENSQTFTLTLVANFSSTDGRVLFDMGADTGIVIIDNVSLVLDDTATGGDSVPTVAAPAPPARDAETVFSIYSDTYTDQPNVVFGAFNEGTTDISEQTIDGDNFQKIVFTQPDPQFLLIDWGTVVNNSDLSHFHMDYWIQTNLSAGLIANPKFSNHVGDSGETSAFGLTNPISTFGEWVSVDVPLSDFDFDDSTQQRDALRQFILTVVGADNGSRTLFLDNIYLHNNTVLSTENFDTTVVNVYPNPALNEWKIESKNSLITQVSLYDIAGRKVLEINNSKEILSIDATVLKAGIYIAKLTTSFGKKSIKLIKR